jgi:ABC-2 type transport system ATP-binding protein
MSDAVATGNAALSVNTGSRAVVLAVRDAARAFGDVQALAGATVELLEGERLALLGPNGAGKTTLLRAVTGRVRLSRGNVELFGRAIDDERRRELIGVVPQEIAIYPLLTARENLDAFGRLNGVPAKQLRERVEWALDWTGRADRSNRPVGQFSGGMKRRLNIACGVLHRPKLVLLDEPTGGVDPQSRERIYEMLDELRRGGATMLLTTHQLEEAEVRCDRIAILDHGRLIASGTLRELVDRTVGGGRVVSLVLGEAARTPVAGFEALEDGRRLSASVRDIGAELPALIERARQAGVAIEDVEVERHGLHEVFLHLTGKDLRE